MAKSIIVYGVPGGKTRFAQRIADHFGLELAPKEFCREKNNCIWTEGRLYLARSPIKPDMDYEPHSRSFQEVADEINATISLTDWQSGPPPMVGEWIASIKKDRYIRRWWDGKRWSIWYSKLMDQEKRDFRSSSPCIAAEQDKVRWCGLSAEPIVVHP